MHDHQDGEGNEEEERRSHEFKTAKNKKNRGFELNRKQRIVERDRESLCLEERDRVGF